MAADQNIDANAIMNLLFALSRNALCSEVPPVENRNVGLQSPKPSPSPPPSTCDSSSLQEAYQGAWDESDSLSDWDAPADAVEEPFNSPQTPQQMAEWLHDPALLHTVNRENLSREYSNLRASKMHLRFESATVPLPSEAVTTPHILQSPEVPLPAFTAPSNHHDHLQKEDLVHLVFSKAGLLAQVTAQQLCFTTSSVALQSLEVLLVRILPPQRT